MNILVATNGSDSAIDAARRAIDLLRPDAHVVLLTVVLEYQDPEEDAGGFEGPVISDEEAEKHYKERTTAGQAALQKTAAVLGPDVEVRLVPGGEEPGAVIDRVAGEIQADVLVVGSSSKGWLRRLFGRSVSDYVAHHAPCPVMIVRHAS
jgi:nucleotide-binding universal stress UspA family protein